MDGFEHKKDRFFYENYCCVLQRSTMPGACLEIHKNLPTDWQLFLVNLYNFEGDSFV